MILTFFLGECKYEDKTGEINDKVTIKDDTTKVLNFPINETDKSVDHDSINDTKSLDTDSSDDEIDTETTIDPLTIDNQNETDRNLNTVSTIEEDEADKSDDMNSTVDSKNTDVSSIEVDEADKSGDMNSTVDSKNTDNDNNENEATPKKSVISLVEFDDSSDDSDIDTDSDNKDGYMTDSYNEDGYMEDNEKLLPTKVSQNDAVSANDDGPSTSGVKTSKAIDVENSKTDVISISSEDDSSRLITVFKSEAFL